MKSNPFNPRMPKVETSIFSIMSSLSKKEGALNLSQGFPDFEPDSQLIERVYFHLKNGGNQYVPSPGVFDLRKRLATLYELYYGISYDPESEITITSGATEALFSVFCTIVGAGDEVIVLEPAYDSYVPVLKLLGAEVKRIKMSAPLYEIPWEKIEAQFSEKTKAIVLNTPNNPVGTLFSKEDLKKLEELAKKKEFFIVSDEVYHNIVFDGQNHISPASSDILKDRTYVIGSFGKSLHATGWKLGYCLGPQKMSSELRKIHQFVTFSSPSAMQYAIADFMMDLSYFEKLGVFFQKKRDLFRSYLGKSPFKLLPCSGSYFQCVSYEGISDMGDYEYAKFLTINSKIASIPLSFFYEDRTDDKILRFCFAKKEETLELGGSLLAKLK